MNGELKACPEFSVDEALRIADQNADSYKDIASVSRTLAAEVRRLRARPTPAPGALPELPEPVMTAYTKADGITPFWVYDGMPLVHIGRHDDCGGNKAIPLITLDQARAYAEQCRSGVVVTDAPEWQQIESAPVEECVLVWRGEELPPLTAYQEGGCWWTVGRQKILTPSHWMPLPAPPALQSAFADNQDASA